MIFKLIQEYQVSAGVTARRGHHYKHSLSHYFFSFLDPTCQPQPEAKFEELHTAPTPAPMFPWSPVSNVQGGESATFSKVDLTTGISSRPSSASLHLHLPYYSLNLSKDDRLARITCIPQLCLGRLVWVRGQAYGIGSCSTRLESQRTGLFLGESRVALGEFCYSVVFTHSSSCVHPPFYPPPPMLPTPR
jgi:hypothetical protein